ncbi:hypothetical protein [Limisalsivibrio acetivorans]|uniref:hypothetical protein n=1 Tax=Limisalsivibrio acetivorans TaxID=1304888 RepID=UPI0003B5FB55|nr:hypothetical protein [Limisalsivibrio acetivorans]
MSEDIKFVKLVSGDTIIAQYDEENNKLTEVVSVQAIPAGNSGMQIALLPFGFPYEEEAGGSIDADKILYEYNSLPEDLKNKYIETKSNIRITPSMDNLGGMNPGQGGDSGGSGIVF